MTASAPFPTPKPRPNAATVLDVRVELRLGPAGALSVVWLEAPGERSRPITVEQLARFDALANATATAEGRRELGPTAAARRELGCALFELLDGPERALTRRLEQATQEGVSLALTVALRGRGMAWLADHPATSWRWELLADEHGPLMVRRDVTLALQLGDARTSEPRTLDYGGLRILLLAYSPRDVEPELDYEAEEERVLGALSPLIRDGRAQVVVVEFGSLEDLGAALLGREFDVVHLTGHGTFGSDGPALLMEDRVGNVDLVSPARLLEVLERAARMPELVMISSCLSAGERDDIPSMTAQLVAGGVPAAIGWVQTINDDVATEAAADIYQRLCTGHTPAQAVAFARKHLHDANEAGSPAQAANAWGTLHLITRDASGFRVDRKLPKPLAKANDNRETYQNLGGQGRMRVLQTGFVGRRRALQQVLRVLLDGSEGGQSRAGVVIFGNKGVGKSCLAARAIDRAAGGLEDRSELGLVVLHGALDDALLLGQLEHQIKKWQDPEAVAILQKHELGTLVQRLSWLLEGRWSGRPLVIVLDDFERNLDEIPPEGLAKLSAYAATLLEVLLRACLVAKAKLLVTTTARFELPGREAEREPLVEVPLGGFDPSSLHKLWLRGQVGEGGQVGELANFLPGTWTRLCDRFGRNPRLLDWARTLLRGKSSGEIDELVAKLGEAAPQWAPERVPSKEQQAELVRLFLCHMAYDEAVARVSADARTFVQRARVYELAVPREALEGLCEGLAIDLDRHLPALQNLGLLEASELDGEPALRVSTLVEPEFVAEQPDRWHAVAAEFWRRPKRHHWRLERMTMAWEHALAGRCEDIAARLGQRISVLLDGARLHGDSLAFARRHIQVFPNAGVGLAWAGITLHRMGNLTDGWRLFERAEASVHDADDIQFQLYLLTASTDILLALGRLEEASIRSKRAIEIVECRKGDEDLALVNLLRSRAVVLHAQGDLNGARELLERALAINTKEFGTEEHPDVAVLLHELARVLKAERNLTVARQLLERSLAIWLKVLETEEHPSIVASLHELADVLLLQGDLKLARQRLEKSLSIQKFLGTDKHPEFAASLHVLAELLAAEGSIDDAISTFRRVLVIEGKLYGTPDHYASAETEVSLAMLLRQTGQREEAIERVRHAEAVFTAQAPQHPLLARLHYLFGQELDRGAPPTPDELATLALRARVGDLDDAARQTLAEGLATLASLGAPFDAVAMYLRAIAERAELPVLSDDLSQPIAAFLRSVRDEMS